MLNNKSSRRHTERGSDHAGAAIRRGRGLGVDALGLCEPRLEGVGGDVHAQGGMESSNRPALLSAQQNLSC